MANCSRFQFVSNNASWRSIHSFRCGNRIGGILSIDPAAIDGRQTILGLVSLTAVAASLTNPWATRDTDTTHALQIAEADMDTRRAGCREQTVRKATDIRATFAGRLTNSLRQRRDAAG